EDVVAQPEGIAEVLERQGMLAYARHRGEVADLTQPEDEVVIGNLGQGTPLPLRDQHGLPLRVDPVDLAPAESCFRDEVADRIDDMGGADAAGSHLGQERLEDEVVLLGEELDFDVGARTEHPCQVLGSVNAGKATAEDHDTMAGSGTGRGTE